MTLLLGLGTGRCGTLWLHDFLQQQVESGKITNEAVKFGWYYSEEIEIIDEPIFTWYHDKGKFVGDVGSYTLPHVESISKYFDDVKLLVLKRNRKDTVDSWMRWVASRHNYWVPHTMGIWEDDGYDKVFPKFDLENHPKEIAIGSYYDVYYDTCKMLEKKFNLLWIKTEDLELRKTQEMILEFCGFDKKLWNFDKCRKNENPKVEAINVEIPKAPKKVIKKEIKVRIAAPKPIKKKEDLRTVQKSKSVKVVYNASRRHR